ncbi:hypothetical protein [Serratia marcescens]|uniref:hypothetical protein n=1 Tax=Serratia marcescens TaxID=615 RepID=UPI0024A74365|nr:hypothetical protein [Serratia marcescens]
MAKVSEQSDDFMQTFDHVSLLSFVIFITKFYAGMRRSSSCHADAVRKYRRVGAADD